MELRIKETGKVMKLILRELGGQDYSEDLDMLPCRKLEYDDDGRSIITEKEFTDMCSWCERYIDEYNNGNSQGIRYDIYLEAPVDEDAENHVLEVEEVED